MSRLRVAVIGAGNIAQQHLPVLTDHPDCEVAVLCDGNAAVLAETAQRFEIGEQAADADALLRRDDLDAVFVLVSVLQVAAVAGKFIAAGMPTFVEKPPGIYSADTARLAELAEKHGTVATVGLHRRFYSTTQAVRHRLAQQGPLATITVEAHGDFARLNRAKFPPLVRQRWAYANGIHALDLLRFFGGEVDDIQSFQGRYGRYDGEAWPDCHTAMLRFASGAHGRALLDHMAPGGYHYEVRCVGARATSGRSFGTAVVTVSGQPDQHLELDSQDQQYKAGFWRQDSAFLAGVRAGRQPPFPAVSLSDAHRTMQMIDQILQFPPAADAATPETARP